MLDALQIVSGNVFVTLQRQSQRVPIKRDTRLGHLLCQGISSISAVCLRPPPAWAGPFSVKQTRTPARMGFLPNKLSPQAVVPRTSYFAPPLPCQRDTSSTAGHGGPSRKALRNSVPDRRPLGCWSSRRQRHAAIIASVSPRHSPTSS